jgi:hypothetical protein
MNLIASHKPESSEEAREIYLDVLLVTTLNFPNSICRLLLRF